MYEITVGKTEDMELFVFNETNYLEYINVDGKAFRTYDRIGGEL